MSLRKAQKHQWFLLFGILLLVSVIFTSFWSFYKIEKLTQSQKEILYITENIDSIENSINQYFMLSKNIDNKTKLVKISDTIDKMFENVYVQTKNNPEKLNLLNNAKKIWDQSIKNNDNNGSIAKLALLDIIFAKIDRNAMNKVQLHDPEIINFIDNIMSLMMLLSILSILLISFSLRSIYIENYINKELMIKLQKSQKEAEEASSSKSRFLATVSHELRTPLNGIIGLSDVLNHSDLPDKEHKIITSIIHSSKVLLRIINDILDFTKFESISIKVNKESFLLRKLFDQIFETLDEKVKEKSLEMKLVYDERLPKKIVGDPDRLAQIFFNLIGNSIKFTPMGGKITIKVDCMSSLKMQNDIKTIPIKFSVIDTGLGIEKKYIKELVKPFTQLHTTGTSGESGTGLGLSIAKQIVNIMGGDLLFESEMNKGTNVSFELNMTIDQRVNPDKSIEEIYNDKDLIIEEKSFRILIAEDNPTNQFVIKLMLEKMGIISTIVENGLEAIDQLKKQEFDLILMDCFMPRMNGFEATKKIREFNTKIPILAITASANPEDENKCRAVGMNGFINKPITMNSLKLKMNPYFMKKGEVSHSNDKSTLQELADKISRRSTEKVVSIYIKTLIDFESQLKEERQLEQLNRLGHKYASSSQTVGAMEFSKLCKNLERSSSIEEALGFSKEIMEEIPMLVENLKNECESLR